MKIRVNKKSYFRLDIDEMNGYTPGEQPKMLNLIKLNTNENPYPPSPKVIEAIRNFELNHLRLYPDPMCDSIRDVIAGLHGVNRENVIAGNGSDDILTMAIRCFTDSERVAACFDPTYSLYNVLARMQGAKCIKIRLKKDFSLPTNAVKKAEEANLLLIARPNSPTGCSYPLQQVADICEKFDGVVLIDEAYADFAGDNCADFVKRFDNVIISRTMSKSYSLAGIRFGYALSSAKIIDGMMKVKDSYNVSMLTQTAVKAALLDREYLAETVAKILNTRKRLVKKLAAMGFEIVESDANFVFAAPPDSDGKNFFNVLRDNQIVTRYFPGKTTGRYVRISIGTDEQINKLLEIAKKLYQPC
ncbi:MAG: histidinol-phosphate transaminase [Lentisphaerota bacterium]